MDKAARIRGKYGLLTMIFLLLVSIGELTPGSANENQESSFTFCGPENLSGGVDGDQSPGVSTNPRIAVDSAGTIFVVWEEEKDEDGKNREILLSYFGFDVGCFTPPEGESPIDSGIDRETLALMNISDNPGASKTPDLVVTGNGSGFVVWQDNTLDDDSPGQETILIKRFVTNVELQDTLNVSEKTDVESLIPSIGADQLGRLFIAWGQETPFGDSSIIFQSDRAYAPKMDISQGLTNFAEKPRLAVIQNTGEVLIVWQGIDGQAFADPTEIFFSSSQNAQQSFVKPRFSLPTVISHTPGNSEEPAIVVDKTGTQMVVWSDDTLDPNYNPQGDWEILFRRSPGPFSPPFNISGNCHQGSEGDSRQPAIAVDALGNIVVAWQEEIRQENESNKEIFLATPSVQSEAPFECLNISKEIERIVEGLGAEEGKGSPRSSNLPALVTTTIGSAEYIFVVWQEEEEPRGNTEIYFMALKKNL